MSPSEVLGCSVAYLLTFWVSGLRSDYHEAQKVYTGQPSANVDASPWHLASLSCPKYAPKGPQEELILRSHAPSRPVVSYTSIILFALATLQTNNLIYTSEHDVDNWLGALGLTVGGSGVRGLQRIAGRGEWFRLIPSDPM